MTEAALQDRRLTVPTRVVIDQPPFVFEQIASVVSVS
jgi:hypothetical protein